MTSITSTVASLSAQQTYQAGALALMQAIQKLATGEQINSAADDPAGLITSENLRAVLAALDAEARSLQRVDYAASVADSALGEASALLAEANALTVANANSAGLSPEEQAANQMEIDSILASVDRLMSSTSFNGQAVFDGSLSLTAGGAVLDIDQLTIASLGEAVIDGQTYTLADVASGGALNTVNGDLSGANQAIGAAISQINTLRGSIGAFQSNTISAQYNGLQTAIETTAAANSVIRDTDYAVESANLVRAQLLEEISLSMLSLGDATRQKLAQLLIG